MRTRQALCVAVAGLAVILTAACGGAGSAGADSHDHGAEDEFDIWLDYPVYASLNELWERADLVAEVVIESEGVSDRLLPTILKPGDEGYGDPEADPLAGLGEGERAEADAEAARDPGMPVTVFEARVATVFKGEDVASVSIKQPGDSDTRVADVIYLSQGGSYVVFLEIYEDSPASLLNPWQAQYVVDGTELRPVESEYAIDVSLGALVSLQRE